MAHNNRGEFSASALPPEQKSRPIPVRTETIHLQASSDVSRYPAVVRPRIEVDVGFRVGGKVVKRYVDVATRVEAGAELARLEPSDLELQARAGAAQLVSSRADAVNARSDFLRSERLASDGWTTQQEYDRQKGDQRNV